MLEMKFCSFCGGKLSQKKLEGKSRLVCESCGKIHYKNPVPTVDAIVEMGEGVLLIKRKNPPYGWALPGGFVDYGETLEEAIKREVREESNLEIEDLRQFHTYSAPDRDPRCHTISTVFIARGKGSPKAGDDAKEVRVFFEENLPQDMAFDHGEILKDYFREKKRRNL